VTVFIAASAACGLAPSVGWLIAARVLQAVGAALLTPASLSIVLAAFPQHKRALTVSLWGAVAGFAAAILISRTPSKRVAAKKITTRGELTKAFILGDKRIRHRRHNRFDNSGF
jgi:MFS family permease